MNPDNPMFRTPQEDKLWARIVKLEAQIREHFRVEIIYEKALKEIADSYCPPWHRVDAHTVAKDALLAAEPLDLSAESDVKEKFEYYGSQDQTCSKTEPVGGLY